MKLHSIYEVLGYKNIGITMREPDYDGSWGHVKGYWQKKDAELRGEKQITPQTMIVGQGKDLRDYILCYEPSMNFISQKAKEAFDKHEVTGVQYVEYPLELPTGETIAIYRLVITSRTKKVVPRPEWSHSWDVDGYIDPKWWDGSDFSLAERPQQSIVLSPRISTIVRKEKLKFITTASYFTDRQEYEAALGKKGKL
jgi:hypothetical protein